MTELAQAVADYLTSDTDVAALVATRIYPLILPQGPTLPALTYKANLVERDMTLDDPDLQASSVFQIDCWASTYAAADALFHAVRRRLNGYRGTMSGVTVTGIFLFRQAPDAYEPASKLYKRSGDFNIWADDS